MLAVLCLCIEKLIFRISKNKISIKNSFWVGVEWSQIQVFLG